jgi:hypothetical protein
MTAEKEWTKCPKLIAFDWRHFLAQTSNMPIHAMCDIRALPLFLSDVLTGCPNGQAASFDCARIRVPKYILKPSDDGTLIVKDQLLANRLIQIDVWCRRAYKSVLTPATEDKSSFVRKSFVKNLVRKTELQPLCFKLPIYRRFFFLTTEGHIDVICIY